MAQRAPSRTVYSQGLPRPPSSHVMAPQPSSPNGSREPEGRAIDCLFPSLYERLHALAHHRLQAAPGEHSLNTTGLLHEAYLRLAVAQDQPFADPAHFLATASRVMRNVLVDHARARGSRKRGGGRSQVPLHDELVGSEVDLDGVLDLDDALVKLKAIDARQCEIVECRYFGGLSLEETAVAVSLSLASVKRELRLARAWLAAELARGTE